MFEKLKRIFLGEKPKEENNLNDIKKKNYEDELLKQFVVNQTSNFAHINILIITDTHNCLYYDDESIEKIKNAKYDVCLLLGILPIAIYVKY